MTDTPCGDENCNQDRERKMVTLRRDETGRPTVWCDPCIVPIVDALNMVGLKTVASCCGHGRRPGEIILADGRSVVVFESMEDTRKMDAIFTATINDLLNPATKEPL